jgi:hypothetical protein
MTCKTGELETTGAIAFRVLRLSVGNLVADTDSMPASIDPEAVQRPTGSAPFSDVCYPATRLSTGRRTPIVLRAE